MKQIIIIILLLLINAFIGFSQSVKNFGLPFVKNYLPSDYKAQEQNWNTYQDERGIIYVGNNGGLLEYDGNSWRLIKIANDLPALSVCNNDKGQIFIGSNNELGCLVYDSKGEAQYKSLLDKVPEKERNINYIRKTYFYDNSIIFQSSRKILIYKNEQFKIINSEKGFHLSYVVNGKYYVREKGVGLQVLENGVLKFVSGSEIFAAESINSMIAMPDGNILIVTGKQGLFIYSNNQFVSWQTKADEYFKTSTVYCGIIYGTDYYILGTVVNGLIIIDKNGNPIQFLNQGRGLINNLVTSLFIDDNKNLWVTTGIGISYIELNSPFTFVQKEYGLEAECYTSKLFNNKLYIGGSPAIYSKNWVCYENPLNITPFKAVEKTGFQAWDLFEWNNELFCAHSFDLLKLNDNSVETIKINGQIVWNVNKFNNDNKILIIGAEDGIYIIKKNNERWILKNKLKGYEGSGRFLVADKNNNYWIMHSDRITKFNIDQKSDSVINLKNYPIAGFLPTATSNPLIVLNDDVIASGADGFYRYNKGRDTFELFETFNRWIVRNKPVNIVGQDSKGNVWFNDFNGPGVFQKQKDGSYTVNQKPFYKFEKLAESYPVFPLNDSNVIFGKNNGFVHYDPFFKKDFTTSFHVIIRKVQFIENDSVLFAGNHTSDNITVRKEQPEDHIVSIDYKDNSLRFIFSATFFENTDQTEYKYILEGFDDNWSGWTKEIKKEYTKIREGNYTFKVRARNVYKTESNIAAYKFEVLPPWYRTFEMYFLYGATGILFIWLLLYLNSRRLKSANARLEFLIRERTHEIREKNAELEAQKEEISAQAEELAKLSIVASETDNAVVIMDSNGTLEWVNDGFTKLYGYTFDEYKHKFGTTIFEVSTNPDIHQAIRKCITDKKSIKYESVAILSSNERVWVQSTLTPILNEDNKIIKLIAIDSDISEIKKAEELIKEKNEHIQASIRTAKTIQTAILPSKNLINNYFDCFILYKPKDIVSGDFYWHTIVNPEQYTEKLAPASQIHFFAVADCTGHGVPGAFMSMICSRLLSEAVVEKSIHEPSLILETVNKSLINALKQEYEYSNSGMDVCLCKIEKNHGDKYAITYCGAKRPLFYLNSATAEIIEIKALKRSIGIISRNKVVDFVDTKFELKSNDIIYMSTDGYSDQNNFERCRMGTPRFVNYLNDIKQLTIEEQFSCLENKLVEWMKNTEQRDDITVIGLKIK